MYSCNITYTCIAIPAAVIVGHRDALVLSTCIGGMTDSDNPPPPPSPPYYPASLKSKPLASQTLQASSPLAVGFVFPRDVGRGVVPRDPRSGGVGVGGWGWGVHQAEHAKRSAVVRPVLPTEHCVDIALWALPTRLVIIIYQIANRVF